MTKIELELNNDTIEELIHEKIIEPIAHQMKTMDLANPRFIEELIEKQFTEETRHQIRVAILNLFEGTTFRNELIYNLKESLNSAVNQRLIKEIERVEEKLSSFSLDRLDKRMDEFQEHIVNAINAHCESVSNLTEETLKKIGKESSLLTNLHIILEEIEVKERVNAELFLKNRFEKMGFEVKKNTTPKGIPDFCLFKRVGDDRSREDILTHNLVVYGRDTLIGEECIKLLEAGFPVFSDYPIYVEVKTNGDGLRIPQLEWIKDNPDKKVIVFCLNQTIEESTK
jgi:hypothetical protein